MYIGPLAKTLDIIGSAQLGNLSECKLIFFWRHPKEILSIHPAPSPKLAACAPCRQQPTGAPRCVLESVLQVRKQQPGGLSTPRQLAQALQGSEQELNSSLLGSQYVQSPGENFTWFLELRSCFHSTYTSLCTGYIFHSDLELRISFENGMGKPRPTFQMSKSPEIARFH